MTPSIRLALLRKYRLLLEWRLGRNMTSGGVPVESTRQNEMRALAAEFPGCLRELDQLGPTELSRRVDVLASGEESWMDWIWAYHQLMRVALALRRHRQDEGRDSPLDDQRITQLSRLAIQEIGAAEQAWQASIDESFVRGVEKPPAGRLSVLVVQTIAKAYDVSADEIAAALFRPRRQRSYAISTR